MNVDFFQKKHYNLTVNLKKDLNMKNGSKLLWSLLVQGAVIGSVLAYKKIKGDKTSGDDLGSSIDEMEKKDAEKTGRTQPSSEKTATSENASSKVSVKDLISQINSASNKSQEVIKKTANILDKVLTEIGGETEAPKTQAPVPKPQAPAETKKPEPVKQAAPVAKPQAPKEAKKSEPVKQAAPVPKPQPPAEAKKPEATKPQTPTSKPKSVQELNNDLLNQIKVYKPESEIVETPVPFEVKNEKEVVQKNKVNLPKPEVIKPETVKPQAKKAPAKDGNGGQAKKVTKAAKSVVESEKK